MLTDLWVERILSDRLDVWLYGIMRLMRCGQDETVEPDILLDWLEAEVRFVASAQAGTADRDTLLLLADTVHSVYAGQSV